MEPSAPPANCLHCEKPAEPGALFCGHCGEAIPVVSPAHDPFVHRVVSRNYRIVRRLAQGGMGVVYLAKHEELGHRVAVKFLHRRFADDEDLATRFFNEARSASKVSHPYAVGIYDFSRLDDGTLFIVMEYVDGVPLDELIRARGSLDPALAVRITLMACQVLEVAHGHHLVHRDVKPDNVMVIGADGEDPTIKMLDFGIAKILDDDASGKLTQTGMMFGTPEYMSPEQASGGPVDHRSDVYALGLVLYEMLVGHPPFRGKNKLALLQRHIREAPTSVDRAASVPLPPELTAVVMDAIAKAPNDRPASMAAFAERLKQIPMRTMTSPIAPARVLTHARTTGRPASAPFAEPPGAPTETAYELGGADDDEEGFALGTGAIRLGDGFEMGDDEPWEDEAPWGGHHEGAPARESFRFAPLLGMLIVIGAVLGIGLAIRAIDRSAEHRASEARAAAVEEPAPPGIEPPAPQGGQAGEQETEASAPPSPTAAPSAPTAQEPAPAERAPAPAPAERAPAAAPAAREPVPAPPERAAVRASREAVADGRLDDARAHLATALEQNAASEDALALQRQMIAIDRFASEIEQLLAEQACVRADERVIALREAHGVAVARRYYGRLTACRDAARAAQRAAAPSAPAQPPAVVEPAPAPRDGRVLPPREL